MRNTGGIQFLVFCSYWAKTLLLNYIPIPVQTINDVICFWHVNSKLNMCDTWMTGKTQSKLLYSEFKITAKKS